MKKTASLVLLGLLAAIILLLIALPVVLPPIVRGITEARLAECGLPARVRASLGYSWRNGPELSGTLRLNLLNSSWQAQADFGVGLGRWHVRLQVPQTAFSESDVLVGELLTRYPQQVVSNLAFRANLAVEASAERTRRTPVPVWSVKVPVREVTASFIKDDRPFSFDGLSVTLGASGIADHLDIAPMFLRIASVSANGFSLTNLTAAVRATEKALLVTEARAGVCGGQAGLYSLFLDPKTLNAGFTLFVDDVETGEVLRLLKGFRGEATGRLHGKLRLSLREGGRSVRLGDAFLYSTPGETGKLRMNDTAVVTDNLSAAGIDEASRRNVANALADLDYSVLKLNLRCLSGSAATLGVRLDGTATRGAQSVPVTLNLNFNGDINQIVNTGLGLSARLKGNKKK